PPGPFALRSICSASDPRSARFDQRSRPDPTDKSTSDDGTDGNSAITRANSAFSFSTEGRGSQGVLSHGANWPTRQTIYRGTARPAGWTNRRPGSTATTEQGANQPRTCHQAGATASWVADVTWFLRANAEEAAETLKHEGIRAGE